MTHILYMEGRSNIYIKNTVVNVNTVISITPLLVLQFKKKTAYCKMNDGVVKKEKETEKQEAPSVASTTTMSTSTSTSTSIHQFESSQNKDCKNNEENNYGNNHKRKKPVDHNIMILNNSFFNDWKVGNWCWERNNKLKNRDNGGEGIIKRDTSCDDDEDGEKKKPAVTADQQSVVVRILRKAGSTNTQTTAETCLSNEVDVDTDDEDKLNLKNNGIIPDGIICEKSKSKCNNADANVDCDDSFYDDWVVGNWCLLDDCDNSKSINHNHNNNPHGEDNSTKKKHTSQTMIENDNVKGKDDPTSRKRPRDRTDEEERCGSSDSEDEQEEDNDGDDDDDDDDYNEEEEEEEHVFPEDNPKPPVARGKRRRTQHVGYHEKWMGMFGKLVKYKSSYKNTMVPQYYVGDPQLAEWVSTQRKNYRNDKLRPKRITLLNSIEFEWEGNRGRKEENDKLWMKMIQKLVAYKQLHKNTMVPQNYDEDPQLGQWVATQRKNYKNDKLCPNRITLLNSIEFEWEGNQGRKVDDEIWMKMFQKLLDYKKLHKNTMVPRRYSVDPKLGLWVSQQRISFKNNGLIKERFDILDSIDFVWRAR